MYTGLAFDHKDPNNGSLKGITLQLTTPKPLTEKMALPSVPQFQTQGYKLVISDGVVKPKPRLVH